MVAHLVSLAGSFGGELGLPGKPVSPSALYLSGVQAALRLAQEFLDFISAHTGMPSSRMF